MVTFAIKANELNKYLTVPDVDGVKVRLCYNNSGEYGTNQIWIKKGSMMKWAERPYMYLGLNRRNELQLTTKEDKIFQDNRCNWTINSSKLCLKIDPSIGLSMVNDTILGQTSENLTWKFIPVPLPRPATSCHLRYGPELPLSLNSATDSVLPNSLDYLLVSWFTNL